MIGSPALRYALRIQPAPIRTVRMHVTAMMAGRWLIQAAPIMAAPTPAALTSMSVVLAMVRCAASMQIAQTCLGLFFARAKVDGTEMGLNVTTLMNATQMSV